MTIEPRAEEIARIEHELEILRSRYASLEYWGRVMKHLVSIGFPILTIVIVALLIVNRAKFSNVIGSDIEFWGCIALFVAIIGCLLWIARTSGPEKPNRCIDMASPLPDFVQPFYPNVSSDAELIEEQIAIRERRLAELKRPSP